MLELYQRIQHSQYPLNDSLSFANTWNFFAPDPSTHFEALVSTGPYAGTLQAFSTGVNLRTRYRHLLDAALAREKSINLWASGSHRVIETAKYFGAGFFGIDYSAKGVAKLHIIPETADLGGNTLTPGDTCLTYANKSNPLGHDYGYAQLSAFRSTYLPSISARLALTNPAFPLSETEVYTMQELCGFETIALGSSPWCTIFPQTEMESFEYARDLLHYYRAGPGNPYAATMGFLYLNATMHLLRQGGAKAGELFFSFVHDGDIVPLLAALDLLPQTPHLPTTHVLHNRTWRTSDVVPMGGRIIFERLICPARQACWDNAAYGYPNHVYCEAAREEVFVRINVNDGAVGMPGCDSGPSGSCALEDFVARVKRRGDEAGDFKGMCGLSEDTEGSVDFLHQ
jgi:acid phosphatase